MLVGGAADLPINKKYLVTTNTFVWQQCRQKKGGCDVSVTRMFLVHSHIVKLWDAKSDTVQRTALDKSIFMRAKPKDCFKQVSFFGITF